MAEDRKNIKTIQELLGGTKADFTAAEQPESKKAPPSLDLPVPDLQVLKEQVKRNEDKPEEVQYVLPKESQFKKLFSLSFVVYPLIFLLTLGFFYLILNFAAVTSQIAGIFDRPEKATNDKPTDLSATELVAYQKWTRKFFVYLNDAKVMDQHEDPDQDGLMNMLEFRLGTNPLIFDTDHDGFDDGQEVLSGTNPLYEGLLQPWQNEVIAKSIDLKALASRKQLEEVSGETREVNYEFNPVKIEEASASTAPTSPSPVSAQQTYAGGSLTLDNFQIDPSIAGNIKIPRLGVDVKVTWSKLFEQMEEDLKYGVAHHPATPYPGERGTSSIHGHSSGNPWDGNFKTIFTKLNFLEAGDEVFVTVYGTDGTARQYRFMVKTAKVYEKTDTVQFNAGEGYFLNLSTSWPVGTARQRYVVTTELVGVE